MAFQLIEAIVPKERAPDFTGRGDESPPPIGVWTSAVDDERVAVRVLVPVEQTEDVIEWLEEQCHDCGDYRLMLFSIDATLPRPQSPDSSDENGNGSNKHHDRVSREELYEDVAAGAKLTVTYLITVALSTIVAGIGLTRDDTAVIIGAMVIAPLLGPNVAMALATTLGDYKLGWQAIKVNVSGLLLALGLAVCMGFLLHVDPQTPAIKSRTQVEFGDILLALCAGSAGVLALSRGISAALVGVMVAVALLPPLVVFGLLLAAQRFYDAPQAALLVATNVICVNLAGVATFLLQGMRPRNWYEADRARRGTWIALGVWAVLLALLIAIIYVSREDSIP